jgi:hypothetical protein
MPSKLNELSGHGCLAFVAHCFFFFRKGISPAFFIQSSLPVRECQPVLKEFAQLFQSCYLPSSACLFYSFVASIAFQSTCCRQLVEHFYGRFWLEGFQFFVWIFADLKIYSL